MANDNVIPFPGAGFVDIDASTMLESIAKDKPKFVFVIVWDGVDGSTPIYFCNQCDKFSIMYRLQKFIHGVYSGVFG